MLARVDNDAQDVLQLASCYLLCRCGGSSGGGTSSSTGSAVR